MTRPTCPPPDTRWEDTRKFPSWRIYMLLAVVAAFMVLWAVDAHGQVPCAPEAAHRSLMWQPHTDEDNWDELTLAEQAAAEAAYIETIDGYNIYLNYDGANWFFHHVIVCYDPDGPEGDEFVERCPRQWALDRENIPCVAGETVEWAIAAYNGFGESAWTDVVPTCRSMLTCDPQPGVDPGAGSFSMMMSVDLFGSGVPALDWTPMQGQVSSQRALELTRERRVFRVLPEGEAAWAQGLNRFREGTPHIYCYSGSIANVNGFTVCLTPTEHWLFLQHPDNVRRFVVVLDQQFPRWRQPGQAP